MRENFFGTIENILFKCFGGSSGQIFWMPLCDFIEKAVAFETQVKLVV